MKPSLPERAREHEAPHVRSPEMQILDALVRIEELLVNLNERLAGPRPVEAVEPESEAEPETAPKTAPKRRPRSL